MAQCQLALKLGEKKVSFMGLLLLIPGLLMTGAAQTVGMFYLGLGFLAVGSALATPCLTALASLYTPVGFRSER